MATVFLRVAKSRLVEKGAGAAPVWVGGGRRGNGIVIAANRAAKKFGIKTGMACFEAKAAVSRAAILSKPHYDEYHRHFAEHVSCAGRVFAHAGANLH